MAWSLPRSVQKVIDHFEQLPGIGPKSAQRLALYMLHVPDHVIADFSQSLLDLKQKTVLCTQCHQLTDHSPCAICDDETRDAALLCVVEQPLDVLAIEQTGSYKGRYHVLHGVIAPMDNIGPDQLFLRDIIGRLTGVTELILATNPTLEGEATALYMEKIIREAGITAEQLKISRIGHGLPMGADIEYADGLTLARALDGRRQI
jgi:recombination protein RecR